MLDGFAYQSPPPSYCSRAIVSFAVGAGPNDVSVEREKRRHGTKRHHDFTAIR